jgi:hypothetical protein
LNFLSLPLIYAKESQALKKKKIEPTELTPYDRKVLEIGEISGVRRVTGSFLALIPGFGIGHAVQGRYQYKGLVFTLTEMGCVGLFAFGREGGTAAIFPFLGFKIWEFVDSIVGPGRHNLRYHQLQSLSLNTNDNRLSIMPIPIVRKDDSGQQKTHIGLALNWNIP